MVVLSWAGAKMSQCAGTLNTKQLLTEVEVKSGGGYIPSREAAR